MKKILIFGLPRTGTTLLQKQLSNFYNLKNTNEPFATESQAVEDPVAWAHDQNNCVIKLLTSNPVYYTDCLEKFDTVELIKNGNFDCVIVTVRKSLADCCISLFYAERKTGQYHYRDSKFDHREFTCDLEFVDNWMNHSYKKFSNILNKMQKENVPFKKIYYEDYVNNVEQDINGMKFKSSDCHTATLNLNLPYQNLCLNYTEVQNRINKLLENTP
jgi:hypothetical protein